MKNSTNKLIKISLLSAVALILMYFDFPVIPAFAWLKMDLSDVPALLGAFGFGPLVGIIIELIKNILYFFTKGSSFAGVLANFLFGVALVYPAGLIYHKKKRKSSAVIGMIVGTIIMEVAGVFGNVYILLPLYGMRMSPEQLTQYVVAGIVPFNAVKALIVNISTYFVYKRVSVAIFKAEPNLGSGVKDRIA
ncbi:MAG: ECF transporter S component [Clostridium butyricum]|nr:ECF transporter S component [Clostridium butyricum]